MSKAFVGYFKLKVKLSLFTLVAGLASYTLDKLSAIWMQGNVKKGRAIGNQGIRGYAVA